MSSKFTAPLIFSSALALGAMGFVACGEDSNPTLPPSPTSSSSGPISMATPSVETAIVFTGLGATVGNTSVKFSGTISIDFGDSNTVADVSAARFTSVTFDVVKAGTLNPQGTAAFATPIDFANTFIQTVPLQEWGLMSNLETGYTECGSFELIITAVVEDGVTEPSVSIEKIPFERPSKWCLAPESSSSEAPEVTGVPLTKFEVEINTKVEKCINIATKQAAETGDICFGYGESSNRLYSDTGVKFALYANREMSTNPETYYGTQLRPELMKSSGIAETTDFLYRESALQETYPNFYSVNDQFFVGIRDTYDPYTNPNSGFYAFIVKYKGTKIDNGSNVKGMKVDVYTTAQ